MSKFIKLSLTVLVLFILTSAVFPADDVLMDIIAKINVYHQQRPQQKIYVHVDKPLYAAGESLWFSIYVVDAFNHTPDSLSKIVYAELFSPHKILLQRHILHATNGITQGDFELPDSLKTGNYTLRAYTNYMRNIGDDFLFTKEITILNTSTETKPKPEENLLPDIQFFPEGGNLINGVENFIAFKATNQYGKGIDITGEIIDDNDEVITSFTTEHHGMGSLKIPPAFNKRYRARIKNSGAIINLPDITEKGFLLRVLDMGAYIKVIAYTNLKAYSDAPCFINIIAQSGGVVSFAAHGEIANTALTTNIPKSKLPSGITQITLFNGAGTPQCERLFFVNHQNTMTLSIQTNSNLYHTRQAVDIDLTAQTKLNQPVQGYFSMSVYDASKVEDPENYPSSIASHLLLTSDLKGRIEDPGYYFKDTLSLTKHHLDLVMLTHGWRRFTWKEVLNNVLPSLEHYSENGIVISGKLQKTFSSKPAANSELKIMKTLRDILILKTDSLGNFYSDALLYYDSTELFIQTDNAKGKQTDLKFTLDPFKPAPSLTFNPIPFGELQAKAFIAQSQIINKITQGYKNEQAATMLKEVEVKAEKIESNNTTPKLYGHADATVNMKDIPPGYINILQVLQGRVAGVMISGIPPTVSIRGGGQPLFLLNGMQVDFDMVSNINTNDVESIDILKGVSASIYGGRGGNGVIAIYTKKGGGYSTNPTIGIHKIKYPGLYKAKEFYTPRYDQVNDSTVPDIRNTLYWNPSIKTDANGHAHLRFFTADVTSRYKIILEGISHKGEPGANTKEFVVE